MCLIFVCPSSLTYSEFGDASCPQGKNAIWKRCHDTMGCSLSAIFSRVLISKFLQRMLLLEHDCGHSIPGARQPAQQHSSQVKCMHKVGIVSKMGETKSKLLSKAFW